MRHTVDLGKLVKQVRDTHEEFKKSHPVVKWGGKALMYRESRSYNRIIQLHYDAVEGKVSFNPFELWRVRWLANRYLRYYTGKRLHPSNSPSS